MIGWASYAERSAGLQKVPSVCPPTPDELRTSCCSVCGEVRWVLVADQALPGPSKVFLPAAMVETTFPQHSCQSVSTAGQPCSGKLSTDGRYYGLLRQTAAVAFGLELLYQWSSRMADRGIAWATMWRDVLSDIKTWAVDSLSVICMSTPSLRVRLQLFAAGGIQASRHTF